MDDAVVKRYAEAAEKVFPKDPAGFCKRMAEEQRIIWTRAGEFLAKKKAIDSERPSEFCPECGGMMKQSGTCKVGLNCGGTSGCG